jgi:hypothetical protein
MICIQCGTFNPDTATFCGKCGWRFDQAASMPENVVIQQITPSPQVPMSDNPPIEPTTPFLPPLAASEAPPTPPPTGQEPRYKVLARSMPLWALIGGIVAVVVLLVVLQVTGSDWAAGAERVVIAAGILALVIALRIADSNNSKQWHFQLPSHATGKLRIGMGVRQKRRSSTICLLYDR